MLYRLATEEIPPFAIIKDLFEFIDKRRDGLLDLTEWMDAFSKFSNPNEKKRYIHIYIIYLDPKVQMLE